MQNLFHLTKGNVAFLKTLVALERAGRGLALVALKRTGCDVCQLECQASNVTASVIPLTHAPETGARKLASVSGASFIQSGAKFFWRQILE